MFGALFRWSTKRCREWSGKTNDDSNNGEGRSIRSIICKRFKATDSKQMTTKTKTIWQQQSILQSMVDSVKSKEIIDITGEPNNLNNFLAKIPNKSDYIDFMTMPLAPSEHQLFWFFGFPRYTILPNFPIELSDIIISYACFPVLLLQRKDESSKSFLLSDSVISNEMMTKPATMSLLTWYIKCWVVQPMDSQRYILEQTMGKLLHWNGAEWSSLEDHRKKKLHLWMPNVPFRPSHDYDQFMIPRMVNEIYAIHHENLNKLSANEAIGLTTREIFKRLHPGKIIIDPTEIKMTLKFIRLTFNLYERCNQYNYLTQLCSVHDNDDECPTNLYMPAMTYNRFQSIHEKLCLNNPETVVVCWVSGLSDLSTSSKPFLSFSSIEWPTTSRTSQKSKQRVICDWLVIQTDKFYVGPTLPCPRERTCIVRINYDDDDKLKVEITSSTLEKQDSLLRQYGHRSTSDPNNPLFWLIILPDNDLIRAACYSRFGKFFLIPI